MNFWLLLGFKSQENILRLVTFGGPWLLQSKIQLFNH